MDISTYHMQLRLLLKKIYILYEIILFFIMTPHGSRCATIVAIVRLLPLKGGAMAPKALRVFLLNVGL